MILGSSGVLAAIRGSSNSQNESTATAEVIAGLVIPNVRSLCADFQKVHPADCVTFVTPATRTGLTSVRFLYGGCRRDFMNDTIIGFLSFRRVF